MTCDCGAALTLCRDCAVAEYQAAHLDCPRCCPPPENDVDWFGKLNRGERAIYADSLGTPTSKIISDLLDTIVALRADVVRAGHGGTPE